MYRWVEHTGELEIEIEAESERAIFEQGFEAMRELLRGDPEGVEPSMERKESAAKGTAQVPIRAKRIELEASDRAALLADWLAELAFLAESEGLVPEQLASLELDGSSLAALVEGFGGEPPHLVKAATYHRLALEPTASGWRASVVLDV